MYFGIDLGTTQTLVAKYMPMNISNREDNTFELIPIYYDKFEYNYEENCYYPNIKTKNEYAGSSLIMPSVLYLDERIGAEGECITYRLVGKAAQHRAAELDDFNGKYYINAKARLESNCPPDENGITAGDIAYELLRVCFDSIRQYIYWSFEDLPPMFFNRKLDGVKIGVSTPLATNTDFSKVLLEQARRAAADVGFRGVDEKIRLIEEPTAALANFIIGEICRKNRLGVESPFLGSSEKGIAMVIDLGGGTTDVAVRPYHLMGKKEGIIDFQSNCLAKSGLWVKRADNARAAFGGLDFDDRIAAYLVCKFNMAYINGGYQQGAFVYGTLENFDGGIRFRDEITSVVRKRIISYATRLAQKMKEAFTDVALEKYELPDIYHLKGPEDPVSFSIFVTRDEYFDLIRPLLENEAAHKFLPGHQHETIEHIVTQTISDAGIQYLSDLDFVYLTGGTSMMPEVRKWIKGYIGNNCPIIWANDRRSSEELFQNCLTDIANGVALSLDASTGLTNYKKSLSNTVMIDVQNGLPKPLIKAGTEYPSKGELKDVLPVESVVGIRIRLYSALNEYSPELQILGEYCMNKGKVIPPKTMLSFRYSLDDDKQISLTAFYIDENGNEIEAMLDLKNLE